MKARTAEEVPLGCIFLSPGMDLAKSDSVKELQKQSRRAKRRSMHKGVIGCRRGLLPRCGPQPRTDTEGSRARHTQPLTSPFPAKHPDISRVPYGVTMARDLRIWPRVFIGCLSEHILDHSQLCPTWIPM